MKKDTDQTEGSNSCSCEGDSCGGGSCKCKWIWLAFLLALVGVLVAKNLNSKPEPAPSSIVEIDTVAAPASHQEPLPRLVDLGASSCIPCKAMKPILDDLMVNYGGGVQDRVHRRLGKPGRRPKARDSRHPHTDILRCCRQRALPSRGVLWQRRYSGQVA